MEINKENYEAYLLDLWEGTLSEEGKIMLSKFLEENPELNEKDALDLLSDISITKKESSFDKSTVDFQKINGKNYEFFFIAYAEGDLSSKEMILVDEFLLENPSLKQKFIQFNKAKLSEETIVFPYKEKISKAKTPIISLQTTRWILGFAAASIAFLFWFSSPFKSPNYKYTKTELGDIEIEKIKDHVNNLNSIKNDLQSIENHLENQIVEQNPNAYHLVNKTDDSQEPAQNKANKNENLSQQKTSNSTNNLDLIAVKNVESHDLNDVVTSIVSVRKTEDKSTEIPENKTIDKPQTIGDIATNFLQRKNVLNEERKPDFKGILNNTFSNVNENKKPIIVIEDEANSKTTVFRLGNLKIERKTKK